MSESDSKNRNEGHAYASRSSFRSEPTNQESYRQLNTNLACSDEDVDIVGEFDTEQRGPVHDA